MPHTNFVDAKAIRKRLLKCAINKRHDEKRRQERERDKLTGEVRSKLTGLDWFILNNAISKNLDITVSSILKTHEKKLKRISVSKVLPFTCDEVVTNLSTCKLSEDELELLKHGLDFAIQPRSVNKTDVFAAEV